MDVTIPKMYDNFVSQAVRSLKHGYSSKDDYNTIDEQASELTDEQRYEFLKRIRDTLVESLAEHSKICKNPAHCAESLGSEQAINSMNRRMTQLEPYIQSQRSVQLESEMPNHPTDHTTARQVIAIRFLLQYAKIDVKNDKAAERFIHFLTGKSKDNIYKAWRVASNKELETNRIEDLQFVRKFFEDLGSPEIVKMLNNEIDTK